MEMSDSRRFFFEFWSAADAKSEKDISLKDLATFIAKALEHSDSKLTAKLDEFGSRLEAMEKAVSHAARPSADDSKLTIAEQHGLQSDAVRHSFVSRKSNAGFEQHPIHCCGQALISDSSPGTDAPIAPATGASHAKEPHKMAQAQRERYMQKFETDEIFGKSVEALERERQRKAENLRAEHHKHLFTSWMLMPGSRFRLTWDSVTCLLVLFVAISLPYRVAFLIDYTNAVRPAPLAPQGRMGRCCPAAAHRRCPPPLPTAAAHHRCPAALLAALSHPFRSVGACRRRG